MFGATPPPQNENTQFQPQSVYGVSKVSAYYTTRYFRQAFNMFAANGILFNHESPRRGSNFVTSKVVKTAVRIKNKLDDKLILGNLDSSRDWGHSKDYVKAMNLMMNHSKPDDFVVATGETRTVRELCEYVFKKLDLNMDKYISQSEKFMRPEELRFLCGDSSKIKKELGWKPEYSFESMIDEMIEFWEKNHDKNVIEY